jgi:COMPASS component SWD3
LLQLWDFRHEKLSLLAQLSGHGGDVYSVRFHPGDQHLVSGGYDKIIRLFDIEKAMVVKEFSGHHLLVSRAIFNPYGNLVISGYAVLPFQNF